MEGTNRSVRKESGVHCRPLSKMTRDQSEKVLKDEIVKCWDDGEVANYDRLVLLCEKTNVNMASEVVPGC